MITREDSGLLAVMRLAHGKVNALDVEFCAALVKGIQELAEGPSRALVLTGTGATFSAGVDLFRVLEGGASYLSGFIPAMESLFRALLTFPKPAVAAVNGHAIAGGCIMAAACDYRIMANGNSRIGGPELAVGVPFPMLPFEIVSARVERRTFRDLVNSGRVVAPAEALALGLIDEIAEPEELLPRARDVAEQLARIPPTTFELTKRTLTFPILERVHAAAALDAAVVGAWKSPEVHAHIREYLQRTICKPK